MRPRAGAGRDAQRRPRSAPPTLPAGRGPSDLTSKQGPTRSRPRRAMAAALNHGYTTFVSTPPGFDPRLQPGVPKMLAPKRRGFVIVIPTSHRSPRARSGGGDHPSNDERVPGPGTARAQRLADLAVPGRIGVTAPANFLLCRRRGARRGGDRAHWPIGFDVSRT